MLQSEKGTQESPEPCILSRATWTQSSVETMQRGIFHFPPSCTCQPGFQISNISKCLQSGSQSAFHFAKVYKPTEKHSKDQIGLLLTYHIDMHHWVVPSLDLKQVNLCFYLIIFQYIKCYNLAIARGIRSCLFWIQYQFGSIKWSC